MLKRVFLSVVLVSLPFAAAQAEEEGFKAGFKKMGEGFKEVGKGIGQVGKETGKSIASGSKKVGKKVGEGSKEAAEKSKSWWESVTD